MNKISAGQIKKIHVLLREIKMKDSEYRAILHGMFNAESSKDLSFSQARALIEHLSKLIEHLSKLYLTEDNLTASQLSRINYLAQEVYKRNVFLKIKEHVQKIVGYQKQLGDLTKKEATKLINTLEGIKKWQSKKKQQEEENGK